METAKEANKGLTQRFKLYADKASAVAVVALAHRSTRVAVIFFFVLLSMWYVYNKMWQPFRSEVELPLGVSEEKPVLDVDVLHSINTARAKRSEHIVKDNSMKASQVFVIKSF